jgi:hypothetical protein
MSARRTTQRAKGNGAAYDFWSRTTVEFTRDRIRLYGWRRAAVMLGEDFRWNVIRRQPMFDHRHILHGVDDHVWDGTPEGVQCSCGVRRPPGNTKDRYLAERRECAARGVTTGHMNDVIFDDLVEEYGTRAAAVEAMCAEPRPRRVEILAGPRFTTSTVESM